MLIMMHKFMFRIRLLKEIKRMGMFRKNSSLELNISKIVEKKRKFQIL